MDPELDTSLAPGDQVARYLVERLIARGPTGDLYSAVDPELDRNVALKLFRPGIATRRTMAAIGAIARLAHRNVVKIHDVGAHGDRRFVAMERIDGRGLAAWLADAPPLERILAVFRDACGGLAAAHDAGIVHGDLKPDNLLVGNDGRVVVTDFGVASWSEATFGETVDTEVGVSEVDDGMPRDAASYAAPERRSGQAADVRSDVYALCSMLRHALQVRARSGWRRRSAPRRVLRTIARGLARRPSDRIGDMHTLRAGLHVGRDSTWWLSAAAIVPVAAAGALALEEHPASYCERLERRVAEVWNDERAAELERAFATTGEPAAPDAWTTVATHTDAFITSWLGATREACAAETSASDAAARIDRRTTCLERQLDRAEHVLAALAEATPRVVLHAPITVAGFERPADCLDDDVLSQRASSRAGVPMAIQDDLDALITQADALVETGRYEDALAIAEEARSRATRAGDTWVVAEAWLSIATARQWIANDTDEAAFHEALSAALAAGNRKIAANALIGLLEVWNPGSGSSIDEALRWSTHAEALLAGMEDGGFLEVDRLIATANLHHRAGEYDTAEKTYRAVLERATPEHGPVRLGTVHLNVGTMAAARGRWLEALSWFRSGTALLASAYGPRHPTLASSRINVGSVLAELGDLEGAWREHEAAVEIIEQNFGPDHPSLGPALRMLAWNGVTRRAWEEALPYAQRALAIARLTDESGGEGVARSLSTISTIELELGRVDAAAEHAEAALDIGRTTLGEAHPGIGSLYIDRALVSIERKAFDAARADLERAIEQRTASLGPTDHEVGRAWQGIAELELRLGRRDEAIAAARRGLEIAEAEESDRGVSKAEATFLLARCTASGGDASARATALLLAEAAEQTFAAAGPAWHAYVERVITWRAGLMPGTR